MEHWTAAGHVMQLTSITSLPTLITGIAGAAVAIAASQPANAQVARATYVAEGSFQLPAKGEPGGLDRPTAIAVGPTGVIHVADDQGLIQAFDARGTSLRRYGQGQLKKPIDIAITEDGQVFVLDGDHKRIFVYDVDGEPLRVIGRRGNRGGELADPVALAVGPAGYVYALDRGRHGIQIFSRDGTFVRDIPFGEAIRDPRSLAVGRDGTIYLTDERIPTHLLRLLPFTDIPWYGALPPEQIERIAIRGGRLSEPVAMAVNVLGTALVLDKDAARLYRRNAVADDSTAASDLLYGGKGSGRGAFQEPVDVAFASPDEAVILDVKLRKVERIHLETETDLSARPLFDFPVRVTRVTHGFSAPLLDIADGSNGAPRLLLKTDENVVQMVSAQVDRLATVYGDSVYSYTPDPQQGPQRQFTYELGDVAAAALGDTMVVVVDSRRDRFAIFRLDGGRPLGTYGDNYEDERRLRGPRGVALLKDGRIVIADTDNNRVKIFSSDLASLIAAYPVVKPIGITVDPLGEIFVWNEDGTQAGRLDTDQGRLQPLSQGLLPARVAAMDFDGAGNLFILDKDTRRVTIIEAGLERILIQLGDEDALEDPAGLKLDRYGNIYLSDADEKRTLAYRWDVHLPPLTGLALVYEGNTAVLDWNPTPERFTLGYEIQGANSLEEPFAALATAAAPPYAIDAAELPEDPPRYVRVAPIFVTGVMGLATEAMPLSYFAATAAYQRGDYQTALREASEGVRLIDEGVLTASEDVKGRLLRLAFKSAYRLGALSQAVEWAQKAASIPMPRADLFDFLHTLADIYVQAGDPREASQQILTLVGQSPEAEYYQRPEVRQQSFEVFDALRDQGYGREALEFMRAYAQSIPAGAPDELRYQYEDSLIVFSARMKLARGIEHWRNANYGEVVSFFENLLTQGGLSAEETVVSWQILAAAYYAYGRRDQAEDTYRQIFSLRPNFILSREIPRLERLYGLNIYNPETRQFFGAIGPRT